MATVQSSAMSQEQIESQRIIDLQAKLSSTSSEIGDYRVVKCMEANLLGTEMPYDVEKLISERQKVRDQINAAQDRVVAMAAARAAEVAAENAAE